MKFLENVYAVCAMNSTRVGQMIIEKLEDCNIIFATSIDICPDAKISRKKSGTYVGNPAKNELKESSYEDTNTC